MLVVIALVKKYLKCILSFFISVSLYVPLPHGATGFLFDLCDYNILWSYLFDI